MPLVNDEDFALGDTKAQFCKYCVDEKGALLPYETILEANKGYFQESQGISEVAAAKMAADLLKKMPAWKDQRA
jgi:hypothetical protein